MTKPTRRKASKNIGLQKQSAKNGQTTTKGVINGEHHVDGVKGISTWACKNVACKAVVPLEDSFCNRCSCSICHRFDENKDPSLWLVCTSENDGEHCCGSSFHIECLLKHKRVGCLDIEKLIHLDGSFCCAACGKISGMLGYLKRQLITGRDARRVYFLCHRIDLIYRLLEGSSCFKELHEIIEEAKEKLESEVGPLDGVSAKMEHGLVGRSSTGVEVQKLCAIAIQKADEWLSSSPSLHLGDSLPAACRFKFLDITASSLIVILKENSSSDTIKGYKLWYWKSREQPSIEEPVIVPKDERKILVFNLSPCTEYSFRVVSFTEDGVLGHSESRCYTGSMEIPSKRATENNTTGGGGSQMQQERDRNESLESEGFKIRNIWNTYRENNMHEGGSCSRRATEAKQLGNDSEAPMAIDYNNPSSVPDPNVDEAPMDIDNNATEKQKRLVGSSDIGEDIETRGVGGGNNVDPPAVEEPQPDADGELRQPSNNGCEKQISGERRLTVDYEQCIKVIRQLECDGHIESDFRKKFLTWYSLRSTDQERRAVTTFIETFREDARGLADQLVDCFGETVKVKKFCDKLWH